MPDVDALFKLLHDDIVDVKKGQSSILSALGEERVAQAKINAGKADRDALENARRRIHDQGNAVQTATLQIAVLEEKMTGTKRSIDEGFSGLRENHRVIESMLKDRLPSIEELAHLRILKAHAETTSARNTRWFEHAVTQAITVSVTVVFALLGALFGLQHFFPHLLGH